MPQLFLRDAARSDLVEAFRWYEERKAGLGFQFLSLVRDKLRAIEQNPAAVNLLAYLHECAFCRFRHGELLDAAHITADADPLGEPVVSNGLSLCRLHHGAFDRPFLAVRPDPSPMIG